MKHLTAASAMAMAMALAGCGGSGGSSTSSATAVVTPTPTPAPTPTPTPTVATPASVSAVLALDFANLVDYAPANLPAYYDATVTALDNTPAENALNNRIAMLGRVLFYDRQLSVNGSISCASCHRQANSFDDPNRFSTGFSGTAFTSAHAMRLANIRYWRPGTMFWDRRAASVEAQASQPIINPIEMGWDNAAGGINALIARLQGIAYYQELFTFAFGSPTVTEARLTQALAQFERAMISSSSRWDTAYAAVFSATAPNRNLNATLAGFSDQENRGRQLFMTGQGGGGAGCSACHVPPTFALAANSQSNGLDAGETRVFKSPSLKSVALSRAFMHDGRFATLAEVVEFYNSGVQAGPALDNRLRGPGGAPQRLNLSAADKAALVAFMETLTDSNLTADSRFSSPFR
ncbi:hypothetical protein CAP39_06085 [Sphingomonas sp. IBVSS1]|nr:hypothetical protein CAP39_06085 [Sphingomonas sp. IBVSS1]